MKPTDEENAALDAFRVFDPEGRGYIPSTILREILQKSLDQVPQSEVFDLLDHSGLQEDKLISFEGMKFNMLLFNVLYSQVMLKPEFRMKN